MAFQLPASYLSQTPLLTKNVHNPVGLTLNFSESTKSFNTRVPIRLKATINLVYMARDKIVSDTLQLALIKPLQPTSAKAPVLQVIDCACAPKTRFMRAKIAAVFRVATSNKNCKQYKCADRIASQQI